MEAARLDGFLADRDAWRPTQCSIGKAMDVVGTRSAMLILREAYYGTTRFDHFAERVGITEAVAAARLRELTAEGLFERRPYKELGQRTRHEYVLTDKGRDLLPAVLALMQWGDRYLQGEGAVRSTSPTTRTASRSASRCAAHRGVRCPSRRSASSRTSPRNRPAGPCDAPDTLPRFAHLSRPRGPEFRDKCAN
ncbi:HxlR family transcriptional regulator, partial [Prescottella equi NBRC 101255 = C 7]